nr:hypothetical protein [Tanacetum cinerariifolium]
EVEINRLKERVKNLEDKEGVIGDKSEADAPIKGRRSNEGEEAAERISTDSEEIARVLTSMDAATVLAGETNVSMDAANVLAGETNVPIGSGFIPTAGPPATLVSTGRETNVPTGSGFIPTVGPLATIVSTGSEVGPTASPIVRRRKGKEVMVESDTPKKKKLQEQIDA